ncbi:type I-E CRISPR-associated protein Cas6/Cse3/CasE [Aerococcaceae bacterium DSM 111020]|nr:type I-E CRISPR-associated protein Cas6/Cse3/CasE [Aerococcaceae bacterium DSM 111020]
MYLTRVKLDKDNRYKMRNLTHLGDFHSWVEESFPEEIQQKKRTRKLWRLDSLKSNIYLLLVSETLPNKEKLEKYAIPNSFESKDYHLLLDSINEGDQYYFQLTANPTKSLKDQNNPTKRGRVVPLLSVEDQIQYLFERSDKHGFSIKPNDITIKDRGFKDFYRGNKRLNIISVTYQGILTVKDKQKFEQTLIKGIGSKKAYGFGLLTVIAKEQ